jgi:hypothetical protein
VTWLFVNFSEYIPSLPKTAVTLDEAAIPLINLLLSQTAVLFSTSLLVAFEK